MSENFVRCYIGELSLHTLEIIQKESGLLNDWIAIPSSKFVHKESYGYMEVFIQDELLIEAIAKRSSVIAENRQPEKSEHSLIWKNALLIEDVLRFISLARAKNYPTLLVEKQLETKYSLSYGLSTSEVGVNRDIVPISNLGQFISLSLTYIKKNTNWLKESGFVPAIYWYDQALQLYRIAPSILEMALYWVSMEIVAGIYIDSQGISETRKKERVKQFIADRGYSGSIWNFLDQLIDEWYQTRCAAFHGGEETLSLEVLKTRRQQVRDFTSLVLVEMLQRQEHRQKEEIARRIGSY